MPLIQNPAQVYAAGDSIPWSFPIEIRGTATAHGYTTGCPQLATNVAKANGTVTVVYRTGVNDGDPAPDLDATSLEDLPVTALENSGTTLEFTVYAGLAAGTYQMQANIAMPDPDNTSEIINWVVLENFTVTDKSV
jgi:hypothetical protein